jgi:hypothetical protein
MEKLPCKNTFDMTVHIAISAVRERLEEGPITPEILAEIEGALTQGNKQVDAFCHSVHERCMKKSKLDLITPPRTNAYGRVMVQPLERLVAGKQAGFSQKQLSNYFMVLASLLGRKVFEEKHDKIKALMEAEIRDNGSNFTWDKFYKHPLVIMHRHQTLGVIAQSFENFEKRLNWFLEMMEGTHGDPKKVSTTMPFTEHQAKAFLMALFDECRGMNEDQKELLKRHISERQVSDINKLIVKVAQMH